MEYPSFHLYFLEKTQVTRGILYGIPPEKVTQLVPVRLEPSPLWIKPGGAGNKFYILDTFYFVGITIYAQKIHKIFALGNVDFTPQNQRQSLILVLVTEVNLLDRLFHLICFHTFEPYIKRLTTDL